jgi:hypothetical protein
MGQRPALLVRRLSLSLALLLKVTGFIIPGRIPPRQVDVKKLADLSGSLGGKFNSIIELDRIGALVG